MSGNTSSPISPINDEISQREFNIRLAENQLEKQRALLNERENEQSEREIELQKMEAELNRREKRLEVLFDNIILNIYKV